MDPLSDVLALLKPRSYMAGGWDAGAPWSFAFGRHEGIKCYAVAAGACWLAVEGADAPLRLSAGDCFLLAHGRPFRLTSDLSVPAQDALALFRRARENGAPRPNGVGLYNGGGDCFIVGGHFGLAGDHARILLGLLPPVAHIRQETGKATLRWCLERLGEELRDPQPGGTLVAQQLAYVMLVQALRLHLQDSAGRGVGWLFALADKPMRAAIEAIHAEPARRWTLQALAERAGMSRSTFALRFKAAVGDAPMAYLTRWRMLLAGDRLANSGDPVSAIALDLGYESESAFSTAFKRVMGRPPRRYGRERAQVADGPAEVGQAA